MTGLLDGRGGNTTGGCWNTNALPIERPPVDYAGRGHEWAGGSPSPAASPPAGGRSVSSAPADVTVAGERHPTVSGRDFHPRVLGADQLRAAMRRAYLAWASSEPQTFLELEV